MKYVFLFFITLSLAFSSCDGKGKDNSNFVDKNQKEDEKTLADISKEEGYSRLVCYNVRHCSGMDDIVNYNRTASVISGMDADFVTLQELDSVTTRTDLVYQAKVLGELLGMHYYFGAAIPYREGKYGVGILSKEPALNTSNYPLPGTEKRTLFVAEYQDFLLMTVHMDLNESDRVESAKIINNIVQSFGKKAYLTGDLNELEIDGAMFTELYKKWTVVSPLKNTFPTKLPDRCIDFILTYNDGGEYDVAKTNVIYKLKDVNVSITSDHFPLFIDFK